MPQFSDDLFLGPAYTGMGTGITNTETVVAGSISGTTMTVTQLLSGDPIQIGQYVNSNTSSITANSYVTAFNSGPSVGTTPDGRSDAA